MSSHPTASFAADPRVVRGMEAQLAARRRRMDAGERPLGWKLGFGGAAIKERLGTQAALVGYLMQSGLIEDGSTPSLGGLTNPVLEPEVAVHMARDLAPGSEDAATDAAIAGLGPALELADIDPPPEDPERILAGNIYQRGVALGRPAERRSLTGATARVVVNGEPRLVDDPEEPTGPLIGLLRHVADLLGAFGERLRAGEVVICGAVVPPVPIAPGDRVEYELHPLGALSLSFRD